MGGARGGCDPARVYVEGVNMRTANEIREILSGPICAESDRRYWEAELREAERRENAIRENEKFFRAYERGVAASERDGLR